MYQNLKTFESLTPSQISDLKKGVIEVTGKAMNRTALGVVDAIFTLYPSITFEELKTMLPDSINPAAPKNYKSLFKPYTERMYGVVQSGDIRRECEQAGLEINASHFVEPNEIFRTSDGVEVLVSKSWESSDTETGENDLQNLINHISQYGILVTKVEKNAAFNKGTYDIKVINPILFNAIQNPSNRKKSWLIWVLLIAVLVGVFYFFFAEQNKDGIEPDAIEALESSVSNLDTTSKVNDIITDINAGVSTEGRSLNFHEILFEYNSDKLMEESRSYVNQILHAMNDIPALSIQVVGHTSIEGADDYNKALSLKRAQAVSIYLTANGIDETRLSVSGMGSDNPIADNETEEGKKLNRRIEFVILDDGIN